MLAKSKQRKVPQNKLPKNTTIWWESVLNCDRIYRVCPQSGVFNSSNKLLTNFSIVLDRFFFTLVYF